MNLIARFAMLTAGLVTAWIGLGMASLGYGQDQAGQTAAMALFDGESLSGWEWSEFGGDGDVQVRDRCIVVFAGDPLTGIRCTRDDLPNSDYELRLSAKRIEGNDFFCCLTFPVGESHCSWVVGGWGGSLVGLSSIDGSDASENSTRSYRRFERDQWYRLRLRVTAEKIECWIDDEQVVEQQVAGHRFSLRNEVLECRPLGICTFQTKAALRDLELLRLKETP